MKTLLSSVAIALVAICGHSVAQEPVVPPAPGLPTVSPAASYVPGRMITMTPSSKRSLTIQSNERNPYARRSPGQEEVNGDGENAEEIEIRKTLSSISVTGQSRSRNGMRILLGDIIIEQGRILPELLPDQSEDLKVIEVSEDSITLAWLDLETGEPTGKTLQIPYDLTPSVSYALHGQGRVENPDGSRSAIAKRQMGILRIGQERKAHRDRMAAKDPALNLPRKVYEAAQ